MWLACCTQEEIAEAPSGSATKPFDTVVDPFAGGGSTIEL